MSARETWLKFRLPALVCGALLLLGYARTAPGTQHTAPWGYRNWSFSALAYSDILALHEDRGGGRHAFPYFEDKVEYPVLLGLGMWWPSVVAPSRAGYFAVTYAALALSALAVLWLLCALPGTQPWAWAASPALLVYVPLNWDLFGILPLVAGLFLWARGHTRWAALALGIAVWAKFFPVIALGVLVLFTTRRSLRAALEMLAIFAAVTLAVNLPFALPLASRKNWLWFFEYNKIRDLEPSLYLLLGAHPRSFVPMANLISAGVSLCAALAVTVVELRTRRTRSLDAFRVCCALVCIFFAANKVFSPQYWLWVVALLALAGTPGWLAAATGFMALTDFLVSFAFLHLQQSRAGALTTWFDGALFVPMVWSRYAFLGGCAFWAAWNPSGSSFSNPFSSSSGQSLQTKPSQAADPAV